ncbi:hypothetical protein WJ969_24335 [Achromobacter xylosoxidans]
MATQSRWQSLTHARQLFNQQGVVPGGLVAEPILRSWRRCADLGIDTRRAPRGTHDRRRIARGAPAQ